MVSNKEFEIALKNKDNINIMNSASTKYQSILENDILQSCKLIGLWKAMLFNAKQHITSKFTTLLYNYVSWECQQEIRRNRKYSSRYVDYQDDYIDSKHYNTIDIIDILDGLKPQEQELLTKRYIENMTLVEIGQALGISKDTVRTKIIDILDNVRNKQGV